MVWLRGLGSKQDSHSLSSPATDVEHVGATSLSTKEA